MAIYGEYGRGEYERGALWSRMRWVGIRPAGSVGSRLRATALWLPATRALAPLGPTQSVAKRGGQGSRSVAPRKQRAPQV